MQWQRAHVAAADIKHENHDMALVFGNEMADAVAKQVAWVDSLAWQVQRWIVEANLQASKAVEGTVQNRLAVTFRTNYTPAGISAFEAKVRMSGLQTELGRNVVSALAEDRPMCKRNPDHAEYWEFSRAGSDTGSCVCLGGNRTSLDFSGPISRNHVVLELCGMDLSISVQIEHAMFWDDQGDSA